MDFVSALGVNFLSSTTTLKSTIHLNFLIFPLNERTSQLVRQLTTEKSHSNIWAKLVHLAKYFHPIDPLQNGLSRPGPSPNQHIIKTNNKPPPSPIVQQPKTSLRNRLKPPECTYPRRRTRGRPPTNHVRLGRPIQSTAGRPPSLSRCRSHR